MKGVPVKVPGLDFVCAWCHAVYLRVGPFNVKERRTAKGLCASCKRRVPVAP
jgi:hypothetical protein